jgi:hypothetical protein
MDIFAALEFLELERAGADRIGVGRIGQEVGRPDGFAPSSRGMHDD